MTPGGGLSADGKRWIAAKPNFFLPVLVLSRVFRRLMLEKLAATRKAGKLTFFGEHASPLLPSKLDVRRADVALAARVGGP